MKDTDGSYYGEVAVNSITSDSRRVFSNVRTLDRALLLAIKELNSEGGAFEVVICCVVRDGRDRLDKRMCKVTS